jgi:peptidoglycan/xylan/chitin deacetylase (PgdA/CDA1 family)
MRAAKRFLKSCYVGSGVPHLLSRLRGRRHVIVTFHRLCRTPADLPDFDTCPAVSLALYEEVLSYLKEHFTVLPLADLVRERHGQEPLAAITFDDGWRDTCDLGLPVLRDLQIPATVFVTAGKLGACRPFWQQELGHLFARCQEAADPQLAPAIRRVAGVGPEQALDTACYRSVVIRWKGRNLRDIEADLASLGAHGAESAARRCFLSAEEMRTLHAAGVTIGSHTVNHPILPVEPVEVVRRELRESKEKLESVLHAPVETFSYPNGSYSPAVIRAVHDCGYSLACTTESRGLAASDDPLRLPRIDVGWQRFQGRDRRFRPAHLLAAL